ncbi:MAG: hypothetical protein LBD11_00175 [Candidatus Peribacteria bacterium]|jgi:hypothetical protein|nr:hypothetical protein [Candidatus Peribacteria bacterium]
MSETDGKTVSETGNKMIFEKPDSNFDRAMTQTMNKRSWKTSREENGT